MNIAHKPVISEVNFVPVKPHSGLLGFASCVYDGCFYFSSIAVHSRSEGGIRLVFPRIRDIDVFHPINRQIGNALEAAIEMKIHEVMN